LRYKSKGEVPKKGEGDAHSRGKHRVAQVIQDYVKQTKKSIFKDVLIDFEYPCFTQIGMGFSPTYSRPHDYDIMMRIEYQNGIRSITAIEIDGATHEKPQQKFNDGIAEDMFFLWTKLDQALSKKREFDEYRFERLSLDLALFDAQEANDTIIKQIFK